jgi:hypothetical protein
MPLYIDDPEWHAGHPDLTVTEFAEVIRLTRDYQTRAAAGLVPGLPALRAPITPEQAEQFITRSAAALRTILAERAPVAR